MISTTKETLPSTLRTDLFGGHYRSFRKNGTDFLTRLAALGDITSFRLGTQRAYFLNDPEMVRDLFVVNAHKFKKGRALQRARKLLGDGLLTSEGDHHFRQRRMIQPAFHRTKIAEYSRSMVEYADAMSESWQDGEAREIDSEMMHLTLRIVAKTLFSANVEDEADEIGAAMTSIVRLFNYLLLPFSEWLEKLPLPQSRRFKNARELLNSVIFGFIEQRRNSGEENGDLLSMLLAAQDEADGTGMSNEQIRDEVMTLFLAGHETTANAMTWIWYLLSQNKAAEARLFEELRAVLGIADSATGETLLRIPTIDDLPALKFTEAVVAESIRLYPPAWAIGRRAVEEHEFGGFCVQAGSLVLVSPFVTQRDQRFWPDAGEFVPERWETLGVKEAGRQGIYFPFGGGVRKCIGDGFAWTEAILLLATIARKWKLHIVPEQKIGLQPLITLRPKYGMRMRLVAR